MEIKSKVNSLSSDKILQVIYKVLHLLIVPAGTAEVRISYGNSVCLSVRHGPVQKQPSDIETPGLHHMIA